MRLALASSFAALVFVSLPAFADDSNERGRVEHDGYARHAVLDDEKEYWKGNSEIEEEFDGDGNFRDGVEREDDGDLEDDD